MLLSLDSPERTHASFDDRNLVSRADLVPVLALAERCELAGLVRRDVRVAGMAAGSDNIDDMGLLRHGAMDKLFGGVLGPSMPGSFLRSFARGSSGGRRR